MKTFFFISFLFVSVFSNSCFAQIRKIPAAVTEAFKKLYPAASNVEWKDRITSFAAIYEQNGKKSEARFKENGEWLNTEAAIDKNELPSEVNDGLMKSKYSDWSISSITKIDLPNNNTQYKLLVSKSDLNKKFLVFDDKGKLLKDNRTL